MEKPDLNVSPGPQEGRNRADYCGAGILEEPSGNQKCLLLRSHQMTFLDRWDPEGVDPI